MTTYTEHFTIGHGDATISMSRGGAGRLLVVCPGLTSTQTELSELIGLLRRDHDVVSFDLRGHGLSAAADRYSFDLFLGDVVAVMAEVGRRAPGAAPVLVGHSLGADLIVHYAVEHPDSVGELVLVDGANPLPAPFITEADLLYFRALWENPETQQDGFTRAPQQVALTGQDILELNLELDILRSGIDLGIDVVCAGIIERYRRVRCPIHMIMSTSMAGASEHGRVPRHNRLWRAGIERLVRERPDIAVSWLAASHALVVTHAPEVAQMIRTALAAAE